MCHTGAPLSFENLAGALAGRIYRGTVAPSSSPTAHAGQPTRSSRLARPASTLRSLLGLAWPIVVSRSTQVVVGLGDALMVAGLGEASLAATTTGALDAMSLFILPMGIVFIVSSFSSQLFGKGDLPGARRYGFYGLAVAAATQVLCVAALAVTGPALALFPYDPEVRRLLKGYIDLRLLSGGAVVGMEALGNYYGGLGNTRLPMQINVAAMVLDLFGNWLLIGGNLGAPAMGVHGAALSSTMSTFICFGLLLARFLRDGRAAGPIVPRLHLRELLRMLRFGIPSGFNWFFEFAAFIVFINVVVAGPGDHRAGRADGGHADQLGLLHARLRPGQRGGHPGGPGHRRGRQGRGAAAGAAHLPERRHLAGAGGGGLRPVARSHLLGLRPRRLRQRRAAGVGPAC